MDYFAIRKKDEGTFIHFFNRGWSIYWSGNNPNILKELEVNPVEFVEKANNLLNKHQIKIPKDFPKESTIMKDERNGDKKEDH